MTKSAFRSWCGVHFSLCAAPRCEVFVYRRKVSAIDFRASLGSPYSGSFLCLRLSLSF
jgi:hypothetical protein